MLPMTTANPTVLLDNARHLLKTVYGYDTFRPLQEDIILSILQGCDTLVLMPTGGGKSVCFQIPALLREGVCLVVSPLIALMKDQVEALRRNGIGAAAYNSSFSQSELREVIRQCQSGDIKLLYVSPEKLLSVVPFLKEQLKISFIAIDEAHCISSWGHDFRPEYTQLHSIREVLPGVPVIALTATADKITRRDICEQLKMKEPAVFISSFDRPNLSLTVRSGLSLKEKVSEIDRFLKIRPNEPGIVYCLSRKNTEDMADKLKNIGYPAACYHAGLEGSIRNKVQEDFLNDRLQIVCATIAFGMGIDKSNVRWVIHSNLPKNIESYYQEIGRAGRDGYKADTVLYYSYGDVVMQTQFANDSSQKELNLAKLHRMQQFAEANICRRKILLNYFGEAVIQNCGNCDVCKNPRPMMDGTRLAQMALSAVSRMNEEAGGNMLINVLRGSANAELMNKGYQNIKTYGVGRDIPYADWQQYLLQFLHLGILEVAYDQGSALKITNLGKDVLFGKQTLQLSELVPISFEKKSSKKTKATAPSSDNENNTPEEKLFQLLRTLRMKLAQQDGIPPYMIFSDATLKQMAELLPTTAEDLLTVSGVGERKMEMYGNDFLETIQSFLQQRVDAPKKVQKGDTYKITLELYNQGLDVETIAAQRAMSATTIWSHIAQLAEQGESIDLRKYIPKADEERIRKAVEEVGNGNALKPIFDQLNGEVEYHKIRLTLSLIKMESQK
ncbi:MAG: helicase RecQ [Chitinophagaceae bacterium]|nr:helicase RecQ [Chitinophagaceae bacterium]